MPPRETGRDEIASVVRLDRDRVKDVLDAVAVEGLQRSNDGLLDAIERLNEGQDRLRVENEQLRQLLDLPPGEIVALLRDAVPSEPQEEKPRDQGLTFEALSEQNRSRCDRWHAEGEPWGGADWSNAMCGEAGEAANVVKKLRRHESGAGTGYNTPPEDELRAALAEEIADVLLYADLVAYYYGVEIVPALVAKFNRVSEAQGFPERLRNDG